MSQHEDAFKIAEARIAEEARERTGALDLSGLGLKTLPQSLFVLHHLRRLDLGYNQTRSKHGEPNCIDAQRDRFTALKDLEFLSVAGSDLQSLAPLRELTSLQEVDCSNTWVTDLAPLTGLAALETLDCEHTKVADLTPLAGLAALQTLFCSNTQVTDLAPLAGLAGLQALFCSYNQVTDLAPLAGLAALETLYFDWTEAAELRPLAGLAALRTLFCDGAKVAELMPLAGLASLQTLSCSYTQVADLAPLAGLTALQRLNCRGTPVADLTPLAGLTALQSLYCGGTQVADLTPLSRLAALKSLDCSHTLVADLTPLAGLAALQSLNCGDCELQALPPAIWRELPALEILKLDGSTVPGVPREVLTDRSGKGCLIAIRAHFADLETEQANITDVKLLLLGNGGVGKTQIARWLAGATFDPNWDSTHGIQILPEASQDSIAAKLHLQIWDFGGQDIYHGTHALFLRNPAIVMAVWADGKENADVYELGGITFRNYPLAYWIDVVRQQAAPQSPVLITQSQCDRWEQESRSPPASTEALKALPIWQPLWVSAKERRGKHALEEALSNAVTWLRDPKRLGTPQIGAARLRVQRRLEALRNADLERPPQQREHRLLDRGMFDTICAEEGGVASTALLLEYLNANGTVIYRSGLFNGQIVLDQAWALDAIYAVFERKRVYKELSRLGGRFTRPLLELLVWQDKSEEEQQLLLGMMRSCGMCFVYRDGSAGENEYIAPDLLPEKPAVARDLALLWRDDLPEETAVFRYSLLHGGMIRGVIVAIGERAWNKALYWRGGLCAYDARTRSRMLVEAEMTGQWQGAIRLRAQGGQANILLQWLIDIIEGQNDKLGVRPIAVERSSPARDMAPQVQPDFRHDSRDKREWYVSYAWGDTTPEGQERAKAVDDACKAAVERGWVIRRDKDEMSFGDDIKQFMDRIGAADRILVIMSAKYFMSFYCVYELTEIWRNCRRDADTFVKRVRLFALPDADFWEPEDRVSLASHWLERHQRLIEMTRLGAIGARDAQKMIEMKRFSLDLPEILEALANRVQPRSFADVVRYAFEDGK